MSLTDDLLRALACTDAGCVCQKAIQRGHGMSHCPAHNDSAPSLSVREGNEAPLFTCQAGCSREQVTVALRERGLLRGEGQARERRTPPIHAYRYEVRDLQGEVVAVHVRRDFPNHSKSVHWERNGSTGLGDLRVKDLPLFGTELLRDYPTGSVVLTEGEKAALALRPLFPRTLGTVTGAGGTPTPEVLGVLAGRKVALWPDNDEVGRAHMQRICEGLLKLGVQVVRVEWAEAPEKGDAADWIAAGGTQEKLMDLLRGAAMWNLSGASSNGHAPLRLRVRGQAPAAWFLEFDQGEVKLSSAELLRWDRIQIAAADQLKVIPVWRPRNRQHWEDELGHLMATAEQEEVPGEFTPVGELVEKIRRWLRRHSSPVEEVIVSGGAFEDAEHGRYVFRGFSLVQQLRREEAGLTQARVWEAIRDQLYGEATRYSMSGKWVRVAAIPLSSVGKVENDEEA